MQLKNKKAFSEITSFILILSLIVVTSIIAYTYSTKMIDEKLIETDLKNAKNNLKKMSQIQNFNTASFSTYINFYKGQYNFTSNQIYYQSLSRYSGEHYCADQICYESNNGFEKVYINLTTPYTLQENFSLSPGNYYISFKNIKNESKFETQIN